MLVAASARASLVWVLFLQRLSTANDVIRFLLYIAYPFTHCQQTSLFAYALCLSALRMVVIQNETKPNQFNNIIASFVEQPSGSPYHTILPVDTQSKQWPAVTLASQLKQLRSNSWSDSLDECRVAGFDFNRWVDWHAE